MSIDLRLKCHHRLGLVAALCFSILLTARATPTNQTAVARASRSNEVPPDDAKLVEVLRLLKEPQSQPVTIAPEAPKPEKAKKAEKAVPKKVEKPVKPVEAKKTEVKPPVAVKAPTPAKVVKTKPAPKPVAPEAKSVEVNTPVRTWPGKAEHSTGMAKISPAAPVKEVQKAPVKKVKPKVEPKPELVKVEPAEPTLEWRDKSEPRVKMVSPPVAKVEPEKVEKKEKPKKLPKSMKAVTTPDALPTGTVSMVNGEGRFVVLSFPLGVLPEVNHHLMVYRDGLKVGELKVSGPQRDTSTVADIAAGEVRMGDEVREE